MFPISKKILFLMSVLFLVIVAGVFLFVQYLYVKTEPEGTQGFEVREE